MAKAVPLPGVQPALLKWARETAHLSIDEVSKRLKKTVDEVEAWETGRDAPSYTQLEKLAYDLYKRPLAIFFVPSEPEEPTPETEFRALPDADLRHLRRETVFLIRRARDYQASLVDLFGGRSPAVKPIWQNLSISISKPVPAQAAAIRNALNVPTPGSHEWGALDNDGGLKIWRKAVEAVGIFVFKDSFRQSEISGFCLNHPELPVVMINNSTTKTRQIFSLIHEVAHILMDRRAISTFDNAPLKRLPNSERKIEQFCNQIAAEILIPSEDFSKETMGLPQDIETISIDKFAELAGRYRVSREVVLRRFLDAGRVSQSYYEERKNDWDGQRSQKGGSGGNYYATKGAYLSERLMSEVFARYGRRQINVDEAADFIGVKPKQINELESRFLRGITA